MKIKEAKKIETESGNLFFDPTLIKKGEKIISVEYFGVACGDVLWIFEIENYGHPQPPLFAWVSEDGGEVENLFTMEEIMEHCSAPYPPSEEEDEEQILFFENLYSLFWDFLPEKERKYLEDIFDHHPGGIY